MFRVQFDIVVMTGPCAVPTVLMLDLNRLLASVLIQDPLVTLPTLVFVVNVPLSLASIMYCMDLLVLVVPSVVVSLDSNRVPSVPSVLGWPRWTSVIPLVTLMTRARQVTVVPLYRAWGRPLKSCAWP